MAKTKCLCACAIIHACFTIITPATSTDTTNVYRGLPVIRGAVRTSSGETMDGWEQSTITKDDIVLSFYHSKPNTAASVTWNRIHIGIFTVNTRRICVCYGVMCWMGWDCLIGGLSFLSHNILSQWSTVTQCKHSRMRSTSHPIIITVCCHILCSPYTVDVLWIEFVYIFMYICMHIHTCIYFLCNTNFYLRQKYIDYFLIFCNIYYWIM